MKKQYLMSGSVNKMQMTRCESTPVTNSHIGLSVTGIDDCKASVAHGPPLGTVLAARGH